MTVAVLLSISDLSAHFVSPMGDTPVLHGVSMTLEQGRIAGLVGESGSGKSVTAKLILRLLPPSQCRVTSGSLWFDGADLLAISAEETRRLRGRRIAYVPQEPMNALNPTLRIGYQLVMVLNGHFKMQKEAAWEKATQMLAHMQIRDPWRVMQSYPYELSGGLRQRVVLAQAFLCNPDLLIADEPTTALDVTVQAEILDLMRRQAKLSNAAVMLITHSMGIVWNFCEDVYVIHAGRIVEHGLARQVLTAPQQPYTRTLLASLPERNKPHMPIPI